MVPITETSLIGTIWEEMHWHLVDRGWDAAGLARTLRLAPTTKNSPVQNVHRANVEKL